MNATYNIDPVTLTAMVGVLIALLLIHRMLRELHLSLNSRLDKLLDTTRSLARAEGFTAGQKDQKTQDTDKLAGLSEAAAGLTDTDTTLK